MCIRDRQVAVKAAVMVEQAEVEEQCHHQASGGDLTDLVERTGWLPQVVRLLNYGRATHVVTSTTAYAFQLAT